MAQDDNGRPTLGDDFPIATVEELKARRELIDAGTKRSEAETRRWVAISIIAVCAACLVFVGWTDLQDGDGKLCSFLSFSGLIIGPIFGAFVAYWFRYR